MAGIYDFKVIDAKGETVDMADYKGKVLLIVNTATGCGFTPQYDGLEKMYEDFRDKGFEILDFPCNQFGNQAPGTEDEIVSFCKMKFGTEFKQFKKIEVNGDNEEPLYTYLKSQKKGKIKWNFEKFLVDREGNVVDRFSSLTKPEKIAKKLEKYL